MNVQQGARLIAAIAAILAAAACSNVNKDASTEPPTTIAASDYLIGPLDQLQIFVWRAPDVSVTVPVRPDGKISTPLVEDMAAAGKTPTELARDLEESLREFIQDPVVTVIVQNFTGPFNQQVRVVGATEQPVAVPYRSQMTVLDVMVAVGGLNEFADGNRSVLFRRSNGDHQSFQVRLEDLLKDGDISANMAVAPGDIILIPESWL